jgi:hypothetical protein
MSRLFKEWLVGLLLLSMLLGSASMAFAAPPAAAGFAAPHRTALHGEVTDFDGSVITVQPPRDDANIFIPGVAAPELPPWRRTRRLR